MKLRADTLLIKLQFLTLVGIIVTQALGQAQVSSLLFTLTFALTFGLWLVTAARKISRRNGLAILILIASCAGVSANALMTGTVVSFSYFKKLIMFWSTVLLLGVMGEYRPEGPEIRFIFRWNSLLACFWILLYFGWRDRMHLLNGLVTVYLTFGFTNPNLTAVFLSAVCMIELIHGAAAVKRMEKLRHTVQAGWMLFFVFETRARNAQLLLVFFLTAYLILTFFPSRKPRMNGWMAAVVTMFPFLFAMGYLLLVHSPVIQKLFSFLIGEGKELDSRIGIWQFALSAFASSPVFGAYSEISGGTGASQMHNSHLDILASYGAPVFGMFCVFLFQVLHGGDAQGGGHIHFLCQAGLAALLLSGMGEAMLFSGGMGIYLFTGVFLMLTNFDFPNEGPLP